MKPDNEKTFALPYPKFIKPWKTTCQDWKKEYFKKKRDQNESILAIRYNATSFGKQENEKSYQCQKKSYSTKNCLKFLKN